MGFAALAESVDLVLDALQRDFALVAAFHKQFCIMHSLGAGYDFLSAHEHVLTVTEWNLNAVHFQRGVGGGHGLEGTDAQRLLLYAVEVGILLLAEQIAEYLLLGRGEVFVVLGCQVAVLPEQVDGLLLADDGHWPDLLEGLSLLLFADLGHVLAAVALDAVEDGGQHLERVVQDFVLVVFENHLNISTREFAQVAVRK